jgi:hypothetical protein
MGRPPQPERQPDRLAPVDAARQLQLDRLAPHEEWVLEQRDLERAVLLDSAGQIVMRNEGEIDGVDWPLSTLAALVGRVDLITHNHPGNRSLSEDDLTLAIAVGAREVNAVTAVRRYRMRRLTDEWPEDDAWTDVLAEETSRLVKEVVEARDAGKITDEAIERVFHDVLWRRVVARFPKRISYEVEERG